jgi:hypothetical protein
MRIRSLDLGRPSGAGGNRTRDLLDANAKVTGTPPDLGALIALDLSLGRGVRFAPAVADRPAAA